MFDLNEERKEVRMKGAKIFFKINEEQILLRKEKKMLENGK